MAKYRKKPVIINAYVGLFCFLKGGEHRNDHNSKRWREIRKCKAVLR
jgi:hypothetical protein